jgi:hypothetical protein
METLFIIACMIMSGLLVWGIGWYCLLAGGIATAFMMLLFRIASHN